VYKALGFKWLNQAFCPASAFVLADRNEARNPQRFIHATVSNQRKEQTTRQLDNVLLNKNMTDKKNEPIPDPTLPARSVLFFLPTHKIFNEVRTKKREK